MTLRLTDVAGEAVLLAGGGRAILLQIANPAVGHGVARHSDFASNPLRRLRHTLSYVYVVAFGTEEEVRRARGFVGRAHAPVHSTAVDPDISGQFGPSASGSAQPAGSGNPGAAHSDNAEAGGSANAGPDSSGAFAPSESGTSRRGNPDKPRPRVPESFGPSAAVEDPPYSAFDPDLQLWVAATLYETALRIHATVYGEPSPADAEQLYREYQVLGTSLQVPQGLWPETLADFRGYWKHSLGQLRVDAETLAVAHAVLHPVAAPLWLRAAMPLARLATAGLLPDELRDAFDLPWGPRRARRFERLMRMTTAIYPRLPTRLRHWPMRHYLAEFRKTPLRAIP